ncbi:hypothetical protein [Promicromonospora sukumoe]|uniref:hypothetical protein n=1 Tax=Promicromonospora sukumoe TaxID=88382 RepID=UPI003646992D
MNQHDDRDQDHGWVDPAGTDLLAQTLGAMAGGVDPASPTGPAAATSAMGRRVRRRRTAKLGGLGGGALALAAAVALGAGQLAPPDDAEVLPGSPASATAFQIQDGYQPPWLEWSDLTCGMPVDDLETTAEGWSVAPAGGLYASTAGTGNDLSRSWGMAASLDEGTGTLDHPPVLVWTRGGVVVDLGPNVFEGWDGPEDPLLGTGQDAVAALGAGMSTCAPSSSDDDQRYETPLPEGEYEVRVLAFPQVADGQRATAISRAVPVRLDADGAHSLDQVRDGAPAIESPEPPEGQVSRFELDRSTEWAAAEMTQVDYSTDAPMRIVGACAGSDQEALLPIELVLPSTGAVVWEDQISCDGGESGTAIGALSELRSGEMIEIRLPSVPDGVAHAWVSLEPETSVGGDPGPECSATGFEPDFGAGGGVSREASTAAAGSIMVAAMECDTEALVALAEESGTELMFGTRTPEQTFALPEAGEEHYRTLVALLAETAGAYTDGDPNLEMVVWPRVVTQEFSDADEAWDEVVAAGLLTAEEAEVQRDGGGYLGMRIVISATDGTWHSYSAGE